MSIRCPRCGLFSPDEAVRCDCGYDFATKTVRTSYLLKHALEKHGGEAQIIHDTSQANIRFGRVGLALCIAVSVVSLLGGHAYVAGGALLIFVGLLTKGLRQRRLTSLDKEMRDDLLKRS